jgi:hypothetical protein
MGGNMNKNKGWYTDLLLQYYQTYGRTVGQRAVFARVPMSKYDEFKALFGNKFRLRYRGPRAHRIAQGRAPSLAQSTCLKVDATHFTAYMQ